MEPEQQIGLSLEQEFNLRSFDQQIENINLEQAKVLLSQLHKQLLLREAYFKHFIKQSLIQDFPWIE
jgi:hypothetical protein